MILAAAQIEIEIGNLESNLLHHIKMIELAAENNADLIVFPEMSLTGYCREEASKFAFAKNDKRLTILKKLASKHKLIIIVGAPIRIAKKLYIGSFIIHPHSEVEIYTKQFLHDGEEHFFTSSFNYNPVLKIDNENIQLAICADINHEEHVLNTSKNKTTIYISSLFFTESGIQQGHEILQAYAKNYKLTILMANYVGKHWHVIGGGKSAFWNAKGNNIGELNNSNQGLLIAQKETLNWNVKNIQL